MNRTAFKHNLDVIQAKGDISYWVIAARLGVHENTVRNWMKREMRPERKDKVLAAINDIQKELAIAN